MGRIIALVYNWWTIFMRLGIPDKHAEAITSRSLALHGIARQTRHGNQTTGGGDHEHAREGLANHGNSDQGEWQGHRKHWSARRCHRLTPFFGITCWWMDFAVAEKERRCVDF
jgi:hypothetical protein